MHLSYSSLKDASECPYRFKLKTIDKIPAFTASIDTIFGTLMHKLIQDYLEGKRDIPDSKVRFWKLWRKLYRLYKAKLDEKKVKNFLRAGLNILDHVEESFKDYELIAVEELLLLPISEERPDIDFKGYIDLVMFEGDKVVIADLKTTTSAYMFSKYLDTVKRFQLTYYKNYYSKKYDISPNDIEIRFIVLEKAPTAKKPIQVIHDEVSPLLQHASQDLINQVLYMMETNNFPKKTNMCYNEKTHIGCPFYKTEHCIQEENERA